MKALSFHRSELLKVSSSLTLVQTVLGWGLFSKMETSHKIFMNSHKKSCSLGLLLSGPPRPPGPPELSDPLDPLGPSGLFGPSGWESGASPPWLHQFEVWVRVSVSHSDLSDSRESDCLPLNVDWGVGICGSESSQNLTNMLVLWWCGRLFGGEVLKELGVS